MAAGGRARGGSASCAMRRTSPSLSGRPHEHELQGHDTESGAYVVRISGKDTGLLAIDRENEVHNTIAAAETGVGAPFVAVAARARRARARVHRGRRAMHAGRPPRRGDRLAQVAEACRRLHAGRPFLHDFDMFDAPARATSRIVQERGFRLPDRYLDFEPRVREIEAAMRMRAEPRVPCNNDLLAENFIDVGRRAAAHRLRVLGQQRAVVRARQRLERVEPLARSSSTSSSPRYYGRPLRNKVARARLWGLDRRSTAGRSGPRSRTASPSSTSTSGAGGWRSTSGPSRSSRARSSSSCSPTCSATALRAICR